MKYDDIKKWLLSMRARPKMYTHTREAFANVVDTILRCHGYTSHHITALIPREDLVPEPPEKPVVWKHASLEVTTEFAEHVVDKAFDILASGVIDE